MNNHFSEFKTPFVFRKRSQSIPAQQRPLWRVGLILLLLKKGSRGSKSSIKRLHFMNWVLFSKDNYERVVKFLSSPTDDINVPIEPSFFHAINMAFYEGLIEKANNNNIRLTIKGEEIADEIEKVCKCYELEKEEVSNLWMHITENFVNSVLSGRYLSC